MLLGACGENKPKDAPGCPDGEGWYCEKETGKCKILNKYWCYPGNDKMPCLNVCIKPSSCVKVSIKKE